MFENIPKNWEKDKLKNILDILRNGANIKQFDNADGIPISRIETIANGYVDFNKVGYANIYDDKYKDYYIQKGDILLSHINSVAHLGKCAFCNFDSKLIHGMNLLLLRANQNILPKFLYYLLNSQILKKQLPSITKKSVNQASMSTTNLGNLNVIYPINKNEQQEIVDVLNAASEIIRLRTACIESAQSLIPALFQEMFGNMIDKNENLVSIGSLIEETSQVNPQKLFTDEFLYIDISSINNETGIIESPKVIKIDNIPSRARKLVKVDDILVAMTRPYLKGFAIVPENLNNNIASTGFSILRAQKEKIIPKYLYAYIRTDYFVNQLIPKMRGANYPAVTDSNVKSVKIPLPDIKLQKLFAAKVQEIEAYIKTQHEELENAKAMFHSLLHHAFTGELTRRAYGE